MQICPGMGGRVPSLRALRRMHQPQFRPETGLARPAARRGSYLFAVPYGDRTMNEVAPRNLISPARFLQIPRISESLSSCPLTISSHVAFRNLIRRHQAVMPFLSGSHESAFIKLEFEHRDA